MRKYQQLLLATISAFSIIVLLFYKSENNHLKYILQVVNFFSRKDAALLSRIENGTKFEPLHDFSHPLPVWQFIGNSFYVYSTFWNKYEIDRGETISIVVSSAKSVLNYKCSIRLQNGNEINGKFGFTRIIENEIQDNKNDIHLYKFICRIAENIVKPEKLILKEGTTNTHTLFIRDTTSLTQKNVTLLTTCLNLIQDSDFLSDQKILQFFINHQSFGINNFLIYNADIISSTKKALISRLGINVFFFPFNFPFTDLKDEIVSKVLEMDCLMRNINIAGYTILLKPNEFLYPAFNIEFPGSFINNLQHNKNTITSFDVQQIAVCMDKKTKILVNNKYYDPNYKIIDRIFIQKPTFQTKSKKFDKISITELIAHVYIYCTKNENLKQWKNLLPESHLQYIETVKNEIEFLL